MSRKDKQARLLDLQTAAAIDTITEKEEKELEYLARYLREADGSRATINQKEKIKELLEETETDLADYTIVELEDLPFSLASDIIDQLLEDKKDRGRW